jgi:hypothetical protein
VYGLTLTFDPSKTGFEKVFREYQVIALRYIWENEGNSVTSRQIYNHVKDSLRDGKTISRASIINFLNMMSEEELLNYEEETCKGGTRRRYTPGLDERGFKKYIAKTVLDSLVKDFPQPTREVIRESLSAPTGESGR